MTRIIGIFFGITLQAAQTPTEFQKTPTGVIRKKTFHSLKDP